MTTISKDDKGTIHIIRDKRDTIINILFVIAVAMFSGYVSACGTGIYKQLIRIADGIEHANETFDKTDKGLYYGLFISEVEPNDVTNEECVDVSEEYTIPPFLRLQP